MIKEIKIGNFKSFGQNQEIPIRPITLIFGANNAGKSSLIHNLLFVEEYLKTKSLDVYEIKKNEESIDLGGLNQFLNQNNSNSYLTIGGRIKLHFDSNWDTFREYIPDNNSLHREIGKGINEYISVKIETVLEWTISFNVRDYKEKYITEIDISIDDYTLNVDSQHQAFEESTFFGGTPKYDIPPGKRLIKIEQVKSGSPELKLTEFKSEEPVLAMFISEFNFDLKLDEIEECFNKSKIKLLENITIKEGCNIYGPEEKFIWFLRDLLTSKRFQNQYNSTYLGPLRKVPNRLYGHLNSDLNSWKRLLENDEHRNRVNMLLLSLGIKYEVIVETYHSEINNKRTHEFISLRDIRNGSLITANDVGSGISQILPILVAMEDFFSGTIYVEQPELHLHPGLQAKWGTALKESSEHNHIIFETHSEHLIKSIQLEVLKFQQSDGQDGIDCDDVIVLYVSQNDDGNSVVKEMKLDETGSFVEPWPDDFFELSADLGLERLRQMYKSNN